MLFESEVDAALVPLHPPIDSLTLVTVDASMRLQRFLMRAAMSGRRWRVASNSLLHATAIVVTRLIGV